MLEQQQALVARLWDLHTLVKDFQGDREKKVTKRGGDGGGARAGMLCGRMRLEGVVGGIGVSFPP